MNKSQYVNIQTGYSANGAAIPAYANVTNANNYIYLIAGVHGDEPEGAFLLAKLFSWLQQQNINKPIIVIPTLNPDGLAANTRVNANGIDLNRNWPSSTWSPEYTESRYNPGIAPLSEPENVFLHNLLQQFKPQNIFSFHSWLPLLDHNFKAQGIAEYLAQYNNYKTVDYIGYPTPGSLGAYVDETLHCGIITYELPQASSVLDMDDIWMANAIALQNYFLDFTE